MRRRLALWLIVLAIVALTFPWDLQDHPHWNKVTWVPFATGIVRPIDLLLNLALFVPLGFLLHSRPSRCRFATALVVALVLSVLVEFAQVWSHVRFPSATDVFMNCFGALLGATLSWRRSRAEHHRVAA